MDYLIAPGWKWVDGREAASLFKRLNLMPQNTLFLSEGSLTGFLEATGKSSVDVEIRRHETCKINKDEADYLGISISQEAIARDVWLTQDKKRLVYAHSVFPLSGLDRHVLKRISSSIEPLARSLTLEGLQTFKDRLEICAVQCRKVNSEINLPPEAILWARHYRLLVKTPSDGKDIIASVTEIFSNEIAGSPPQITLV